MNPYSNDYMIIMQQQPYHYVYCVYDSAPYFMGIIYPPYNVEYVDDAAILNTPNTMLFANQEWMVNPNYVAYQSTEDVFFDTPDSLMDDEFEAEPFLEESLIMLEFEADSALLQQPIDRTSGSGLSEKQISENLHVYTEQDNEIMNEEVADVCSICLDGFGKNEKMGRLECGHRFHADCIKRWLLSKNVCPMCRSTALTV